MGDTTPLRISRCSTPAVPRNETLTKLLGNAVVLLFRHPEQRRRLVEDPRLVPGAVEEILRYWPPSQYQGRTLTRDVPLHGGAMR